MNGKSVYIKKMIIPIIALTMCAIIVILERNGVTLKYISPYESYKEIQFTESVKAAPECLLVTNLSEKFGQKSLNMMKIVLDDMKVTYDIKDVSELGDEINLGKYRNLVIAFQDTGTLGKQLKKICEWVQDGGNMMCAFTLNPDAYFQIISSKLGIVSGGDEYTGIKGIRILRDCMIGAGAKQSYDFELEEGEEVYTSLKVELSGEARVYLTSEDGKVPVLWTNNYGDGKFVVMNDFLLEKYQRGFLCLAYSLMEDVCIYPVIDGSSFYIDDFPAPVPAGDSTYIRRDYGVDTSTFYSTIWWAKMLECEKKYKIKHTGLIIEQYSDDVESPFDDNEAVSDFITYGNMLLNNGGEIGFHGYNHMPLCIKGVDNNRKYGDYKLWKSENDARESLETLYDFSSKLFTREKFSVYVPPSNIISETGKKVLREACPYIKIIASTYLNDSDGYAYEQEFGVDEYGIIETPRITSGCNLDRYQMLTALSELNFHYVQSHFMHPDDVLDADRGAELGWGKMSENFEKYLNWVYTCSPDINNYTGSEMGAAVERFDRVSLKKEYRDDRVEIKLGGFSIKADFLMRVNEGEIYRAEGCKYDKVIGNLYHVEAEDDEIVLYFKQG